MHTTTHLAPCTLACHMISFGSDFQASLPLSKVIDSSPLLYIALSKPSESVPLVCMGGGLMTPRRFRNTTTIAAMVSTNTHAMTTAAIPPFVKPFERVTAEKDIWRNVFGTSDV